MTKIIIITKHKTKSYQPKLEFQKIQKKYKPKAEMEEK